PALATLAPSSGLAQRTGFMAAHLRRQRTAGSPIQDPAPHDGALQRGQIPFRNYCIKGACHMLQQIGVDVWLNPDFVVGPPLYLPQDVPAFEHADLGTDVKRDHWNEGIPFDPGFPRIPRSSEIPAHVHFDVERWTGRIEVVGAEGGTVAILLPLELHLL